MNTPQNNHTVINGIINGLSIEEKRMLKYILGLQNLNPNKDIGLFFSMDNIPSLIDHNLVEFVETGLLTSLNDPLIHITGLSPLGAMISELLSIIENL